MDEYLYVSAEHRGGTSVIRIAGELDLGSVDSFTWQASAAAASLPGPVLVDLSGLRFADAVGARALTLFLRDLPAGRLTAITTCREKVSRVLRLGGFPPLCSWLPATAWGQEPATGRLIGRLEQARQDAAEAKRNLAGTLARLQETRIRAASARERNGLVREQARETRTAARAVRTEVDRLARPRQKAAS